MINARSNASECLSESALLAIACNRLDAAELQRCESHLETCQACREQLDALSGEDAIWQAARTHLRDDEFDQQHFGCDGQAPELSHDANELLKFLAPTDDPHMLGRLGAYEVSGIIGAGGMGIVLKAFEPALARFVALKVLAPRFWKDAQARERFAREARAAASIIHENVIEIYGVGEVNGIPFFAMPYLRGDTLQARIDRQGPLNTAEILRVAIQVASGLAAAHAQGLVHRDIKPANILLGPGAERVWITDFGIAHVGADPRLTQSGLVAGTPQYMSPEQVRGEAVDGRSDLFSLGSVIYAMGAGRPPFEDETHYQLQHKLATTEAPRLDAANPAIPSWLAAIVARLHALSPADRYPSAQELAGQLEQCLACVQQPTTVSLPNAVTQLDSAYRQRLPHLVRRFMIGGLLMLALAIISAAVLFGVLGGPAASFAEDSIAVQGRVIDAQGAPVADTTVFAVQKTWPNNRYQQNALTATTDKQGKFRFNDFAAGGSQYAFLLTVLADGYAMTSEYRLVRDGKQQSPITLKLEPAEPVTLTIKDAAGKPLQGVEVCPASRSVDESTVFLNYSLHMEHSSRRSDEKGEVSFTAWQPGETGEVHYRYQQQYGELKFTVGKDRTASLTLP
jgi:serine/threonine protein kinase